MRQAGRCWPAQAMPLAECAVHLCFTLLASPVRPAARLLPLCLRSVTVGTTQTEVARLEQMLLNGCNIAAVRRSTALVPLWLALCGFPSLATAARARARLAASHEAATAEARAGCCSRFPRDGFAPPSPLRGACSCPQMVPGSEASPFREPAE